MWGRPPPAVRSSSARPLDGKPTSGSASSSKTKGRPRAAGVETTAEDIRFLGRFQGTPGLEFLAGAAEAFSLFIRLLEFCSGGMGLSSGMVLRNRRHGICVGIRLRLQAMQ